MVLDPSEPELQLVVSHHHMGSGNELGLLQEQLVLLMAKPLSQSRQQRILGMGAQST